MHRTYTSETYLVLTFSFSHVCSILWMGGYVFGNNPDQNI